MNPLDNLLAELDAPQESEIHLPDEPSRPRPPWELRGRMPAVGLPLPTARFTLDEANALVKQAALDYLEQDNPDHALLLALVAGGGKTYLAVWLAHHLAAQGKRVLFFAPRHDLWHDIMQAVERQGLNKSQWFWWQPRRHKDDKKGLDETCRYAKYINAWIQRGHKSTAFCERFCGYRYMQQECPFIRQEREALQVPIILCQHQHLTGNHPLMKYADVIIGDENPMGVFPADWVIETPQIIPSFLPEIEPLYDLLVKLRATIHASGDEKTDYKAYGLLEKLGGAEAVLGAIDATDLDDYAMVSTPYLNTPQDVLTTDVAFLPDLIRMLKNEATHALCGNDDYIGRVVATHGKLHLLQRKHVHASAPKHIIWLDATGTQALYEQLFRRPVLMVKPSIRMAGRVIYVDSALNNKSSLFVNGQPTPKIKRLNESVRVLVKREGAQNPAVLSHMAIIEFFQHQAKTRHFGSDVGSNYLEECDIGFVLGTQQPRIEDMINMTIMIMDDLMQPLDTTWIQVNRPFVGAPYQHSVSQFADPHLNTILWQCREAGTIQAVHRIRIARYDKSVYLFTRIPIDDLPAHAVLDDSDIFQAPNGTDPYTWNCFVEYMDFVYEHQKAVSAEDIACAVEFTTVAARTYMTILENSEPTKWHLINDPNHTGRGRPKKLLKPRY